MRKVYSNVYTDHRNDMYFGTIPYTSSILPLMNIIQVNCKLYGNNPTTLGAIESTFFIQKSIFISGQLHNVNTLI